MADIGIAALATFLGPIIVVGSAIFAAFRWGGAFIEKQIAALATTVSQQINHAETQISITTTSLDHKLRNTVSRVDALEHVRQSNIERIVKLETALQSVERSMERLEKGQDKLAETINDRFDQLVDRIVK